MNDQEKKICQSNANVFASIVIKGAGQAWPSGRGWLPRTATRGIKLKQCLETQEGSLCLHATRILPGSGWVGGRRKRRRPSTLEAGYRKNKRDAESAISYPVLPPYLTTPLSSEIGIRLPPKLRHSVDCLPSDQALLPGRFYLAGAVEYLYKYSDANNKLVH